MSCRYHPHPYPPPQAGEGAKEHLIYSVTPAEAGVQSLESHWIPAFAGMTRGINQSLPKFSFPAMRGEGVIMKSPIPCEVAVEKKSPPPQAGEG